jgi:hypothetical protein
LLFDLRIPKVSEHMVEALIETTYGRESLQMKIGSKIVDFSVDLSSGFAQNCPPISYYRVVLRENLWLRKILVSPGGRFAAGTSVATFSTSPDEPSDAAVTRPVRIMTAGIVYHNGMWSGNEG